MEGPCADWSSLFMTWPDLVPILGTRSLKFFSSTLESVYVCFCFLVGLPGTRYGDLLK